MFAGFLPTDFTAYEPNKWNSTAFTLERMKVKDKLQQLAQAWVHLKDGPLQPHLSDEFPNINNHKKVDAQWLYYSRGGEQAAELARFLERIELKPDKIFQLATHEKHAGLMVSINKDGLRAGLLLHPGAWVDRRNLAAKLHNQWDREKLLKLLEGTHVTFMLGDDQVLPVHEVTLHTLEGLADGLLEHEGELFIGVRWTADDSISHAERAATELGNLLGKMQPVYEFAAWTRDNDHIQFGEKLRQEKKEQRKQVAGLKGGDKVRVTSGLFAGKQGVIQSIDSKSLVRVQIGAMAVSIASTDVVPV